MGRFLPDGENYSTWMVSTGRPQDQGGFALWPRGSGVGVEPDRRQFYREVVGAGVTAEGFPGDSYFHDFPRKI